jgi:hypothetical protein
MDKKDKIYFGKLKSAPNILTSKFYLDLMTLDYNDSRDLCDQVIRFCEFLKERENQWVEIEVSSVNGYHYVNEYDKFGVIILDTSMFSDTRFLEDK